MAVMAITSVWATSDADMDGLLPSRLPTAISTCALVTSCRSVCTPVGVTGASAPVAVGVPEGSTRICAVEEYWSGWFSDMARLTVSPSSAVPMIHHLRLRASAMYERRVGALPDSGVIHVLSD
jgi:hypothetical protein